MASSSDLIRDSHLVYDSAREHAPAYQIAHLVIYMQILEEALLLARRHVNNVRSDEGQETQQRQPGRAESWYPCS